MAAAVRPSASAVDPHIPHTYLKRLACSRSFVAGCLGIAAQVLRATLRCLLVNNATPEQRDLREYLRPVLKRWWLILAVVPLVTIGTYIYYDGKPKTYSASTQLFYQPSAVSQFLGGENRFNDEATVENLSLLIQTRVVGDEALKILAKQNVRPEGGVSAERIEDSNFLVISATAPTPEGAALMANAYAQGFIRTQEQQLRGETQKTLRLAEKQLSEIGVTVGNLAKRESLEEQIQTLRLVKSQSSAGGFKVVERAFPSATPVNHDPMSHAIFAFVLSLALAVGAAFALEYLTRKISSVEDGEEIFEMPVLTEIPKVDVPTPWDPSSGAAMEKELHEPFHRLQMNIDMLASEGRLRSILVVSAAPNEGKSMVTRNLGLAFREAGRNVAVLDADFRKATLGNLLDAQEGPGLTDVLAGRVSFGQAVQGVQVPPTSNGNGAQPGEQPAAQQRYVGGAGQGDLAVVPAGAHHGDLAATLTSGGMQGALQTATEIYDRVLIESSPVLASADVLPLLSQVDGVVIVTRVGNSTRDSAERMLKELRRVPGINIIGVVANGIPRRIYRTRAYGYYYG
jgi:Mrp family chromosome partitioning ATPase/capsular polysaccharide biosynthesis protein